MREGIAERCLYRSSVYSSRKVVRSADYVTIGLIKFLPNLMNTDITLLGTLGIITLLAQSFLAFRCVVLFIYRSILRLFFS